MAGNSVRFLRYDAFLPRSYGAIRQICAVLTHFGVVSARCQGSEISDEKYSSTAGGRIGPLWNQACGLGRHFRPSSGTDSRCCPAVTRRKTEFTRRPSRRLSRRGGVMRRRMLPCGICHWCRRHGKVRTISNRSSIRNHVVMRR